MDEENRDSARQRAERAARNIAKREIKKYIWKKVIAVVISTNCGCLLPILLVILIALFSGIISSAQVSKKYDYDEIKKEASENEMPSKDYLFNQLYTDVMGELKFTKVDLNMMAFDKKTLKNIFKSVAEYNEEKLEKNIKVAFEGNLCIFVITGYITEKVGDQTLSIPQGFFTSIKVSDIKSIRLSNTWLREKYPIDWQVVYVLCFYDALDNGNKSDEFFEGEKIRVKKKFIEELIEDVAAEKVDSEKLCDVGSDYIWEKYDGHDLNAVDYNWSSYKVSQADVSAYGAYQPITPYIATYVYDGKAYEVLFSGNYPVSKLDVVYTLTTKDTYLNNTLISSEYDITKLEQLLEKYAPKRDIHMFIAALNELPGGEDIAAEIELAYREVEEKKRAEED